MQHELFATPNRDNKYFSAAGELSYQFPISDARLVTFLETFRLPNKLLAGSMIETSIVTSSAANLAEAVTVALVYSAAPLTADNTGTVAATFTYPTDATRGLVEIQAKFRMFPATAQGAPAGSVSGVGNAKRTATTSVAQVIASVGVNAGQDLYFGFRITRTAAAQVAVQYIDAKVTYGQPIVPRVAFGG